jgi:hypothetical protein
MVLKVDDNRRFGGGLQLAHGVIAMLPRYDLAAARR